MDVATPIPASASPFASPSRPGLVFDQLGHPETRASPLTATPRRLRRSLRLSAASLGSPGLDTNKENIGVAPATQPSSSTKPLAIGLAVDELKHGSPLPSTSPLVGNPAQHSSPVRAQSSPTRHRSPLRRHLISQSDDFASSSEESDDSAMVFFGKPSSAEKKKRIHYEQRVLEKRLKHKDSLVLTRRRPISFNPDDTMLADDQLDYGWSASRPTPMLSRSVLLSSASTSMMDPPASPVSPTQGRQSTLASPRLSPTRTQQVGLPSLPDEAQTPRTGADELVLPSETQYPPSRSQSPQRCTQGEMEAEKVHKEQAAEPDRKEEPSINPFVLVQSSPSRDTPSRSSRKQPHETPRRNQSPIRSVEALIGATMSQNRDAHSPIRSPRRSPRLSLRALQLSSSPTKLGTQRLALASSTPFQEPLPTMRATPSQQRSSTQPIPPSTGLSRFACLQNISPTAKAPETPANRAYSMRLAHHAALPSPFISSGMAGDAPASPAKAVQTPTHAERSVSLQSPSKILDVKETLTPAFSSMPVPAAVAPATPSVRFADVDRHATPQKMAQQLDSDEATKSAPSSAETARATLQPPSSALGSPTRSRPPTSPDRSSPDRRGAESRIELPATPAREVVAITEVNPATPGPVFRQTARRVPLHQHEVDFGVKVSPERSPKKAYANSSAKSTDFGPKPERIPARRVQVHSAIARTNAATQSEKTGQEAARVASVASKAARIASAGASRFGGQGASLPASALSSAARAASHRLVSAPALTLASAASSSAPRSLSSSQGPSVASKASRGQRPGSAVLGHRSSSPDKPARITSGLPRPRPATTGLGSLSAAGPGSRLPRPASASQSTALARPTSRPIPMAIARLASTQSSLMRVSPGVATTKAATASAPGVEVAAASATTADRVAPSASSAVKEDVVTDSETSDEASNRVGNPERESSAPIAPQRAYTSGVSKVQPLSQSHSTPSNPVKVAAQDVEQASARSSSPVLPIAPAKAATPARPAPLVMLDPEQQRLRCLAMQEKARNRAPKAGSSAAASASSEAEESPSPENDMDRTQPAESADQLVSNAAPSVASSASSSERSASSPIDGPADAIHASQNMVSSSAQSVQVPIAQTVPAIVTTSTTPAAPAPATTATGRPLRSARNAPRTLTASATRVAPSRGRALSLNDIIAARKIDVPLSLTDQLRLADTVHKKHNEKTLARYKVTKIQRPYERPPSPDRHDHDPEACIITDDISSHRLGKGDVAPYSTPVKRSAQSDSGASGGGKCVRWYRPLFVGKGSQYGTRRCETRPALKPIPYELDRLGNKVATGGSPKLSKGPSIVIYRNYFKGEAEPADD